MNMKTLFIEARKDIKLNEEKFKELARILPGTIYIAYSIQYKELAEQVRKKLKNKIIGFSQVIGCTKLKSKSPILFVGDGKFHALNLATQGREVYIFDNYAINKISKEEIESLKRKEQGKYSRFLMSDKAGILVSVKPGQFKLNEALKLKRKLKKKTYLFLADDIKEDEIENFSLPIYINTACPRISSEKAIYYKLIKF